METPFPQLAAATQDEVTPPSITTQQTCAGVVQVVPAPHAMVPASPPSTAGSEESPPLIAVASAIAVECPGGVYAWCGVRVCGGIAAAVNGPGTVRGARFLGRPDAAARSASTRRRERERRRHADRCKHAFVSHEFPPVRKTLARGKEQETCRRGSRGVASNRRPVASQRAAIPETLAK
jgi:hypothetical protein